jgi:DNA-3-methyladenine glycosylase
VQQLASGPGRLCQAFGIDLVANGSRIGTRVKVKGRTEKPNIACSRRIGISRATELEWRFYEVGSTFVSRRAPGTLKAK